MRRGRAYDRMQSVLTSGNSGMDVTARVIGDALYIAAQKQNLGCAVYKIEK